MERFGGRVVVVAGGGSGIGEASAVRLASEGASVVVGDLNLDNAKAVAERIGGHAVAYDQASEESIAALIAEAAGVYGRLDGLLANAADMGALGRDTHALDVEMEIFDRTIDVDLKGYLLLTRYAVPHLLERGGAIVYTSSGAAYAGERERVSYGIAKSGVNALMRHVASKWGRKGIRANAIAPGLVLTEQARDSLPEEFRTAVLRAQRSPRLGDPSDIASAVAFLLSDDASWLLGQVLSVDGGAIVRP
ncbi:SDR family NAD(P)-dependent oxidoreductase [Actinocorallia longicatena]|uniref:Glucose 1-dehydrogenase n=1 Tax=Actinocorallia longicatena TaxID=111803 RepID=A0ABP6QEJ7_9ACTN